jgi:diguanylate cyclase (GGDEF)-like protein
MATENDEFIFLDENVPVGTAAQCPTSPVWRVLIIDDDADVHSATVFALGNVEMQHRPLEFLHAYTAAEARELLIHEHNIAVILLDVVMEQQDAGLQLVRHIREVLGMAEVRIILHTGQPGYAPELDAIRDFDINDYKTKSELTRIKLFTAVTSAIRSYEQICAINASRRGLDLILRASTELMALQGLPNFATCVMTQIAKLLSVKPHGLFCARERANSADLDIPVIAAVGKYSGYLNQQVASIDDVRLTNTLLPALAERRNIYGPNSTVLYFVGNAGRDFIVFLDTGKPLNEIGRRLLEVFCSNIAVGLDNVVLVSRLHNFAFYDELSKLPNRTRLVDIIDETLSTTLNTTASNDITLALVDIDHFAEINDALGHQFGDLLLIAVAARLQSRLGDQLIVARVGGDTFSVLGGGAQVNPAMIGALFNAPFCIDGQEVQISATVGLLRLSDHTGGGADAIKNANIALKRAKMQQRSGHFYFSSGMATESRERVQMMHALRAAFEEGKLSIAYQPQIDLVTRQPVGAEALLRWETADGSFIPPDAFIPIAEHSGLIIRLGEWVLRAACEELVRLRGLGFNDFMMSINVSQVQFRHPDFLNMLRTALQDTGAPPKFIEIEITESVAMQEPALLIKTLNQIKQIGISIAIDDFGTGFSSLSYLQQLQVDRLKIDRSFVAEITHASRGSRIAEVVIQLGRNLGLAVIAEGVEDECQARKLTALGCSLAQGNLFASPMMPGRLPTWLKDR